jgi:hypothetical protein
MCPYLRHLQFTIGRSPFVAAPALADGRPQTAAAAAPVLPKHFAQQLETMQITATDLEQFGQVVCTMAAAASYPHLQRLIFRTSGRLLQFASTAYAALVTLLSQPALEDVELDLPAESEEFWRPLRQAVDALLPRLRVIGYLPPDGQHDFSVCQRLSAFRSRAKLSSVDSAVLLQLAASTVERIIFDGQTITRRMLAMETQKRERRGRKLHQHTMHRRTRTGVGRE